jgi:hypothetical protein
MNIEEPLLGASGLEVELAAANVQLLQGDDAEAVLFAELLDGGLFWLGAAFGDFGGGGVGEAHWQGAPRVLGASGLDEQRSLHEALAQDQVDLEGRAQGVAGVGGAGGFFARFAQQGVVGAGIDPGPGR